MTETTQEAQGLYIHFPKCQHLCNYCDFYKKLDLDIDGLEKDLEKSLDLLRENGLAGDEILLDSVFIGGGTPSLWGERGADYLSRFFKKNRIHLKKDCEFTVEMNPNSFTDSVLEAWEATGCNRVSIGVQSFRDEFLEILDRIHREEDVIRALEILRDKNFNYSLDLMLGLPQSIKLCRDIVDEIQMVTKFEPKHLSLYVLTVPKHYLHYKELPDEDYIFDEYLRVSDFLESRGFNQYEVSNFSKTDFRSIHNLKYWEAKPTIALGPSATGFSRKGEKATRYQWKTGDVDYVREDLSLEQQKLEQLFLLLRLKKPIDKQRFESLIGPRPLEGLYNKWNEFGLLSELNDSKFQLSSKGLLQLDSLMDDIFTHQ